MIAAAGLQVRKWHEVSRSASPMLRRRGFVGVQVVRRRVCWITRRRLAIGLNLALNLAPICRFFDDEAKRVDVLDLCSVPNLDPHGRQGGSAVRSGAAEPSTMLPSNQPGIAGQSRSWHMAAATLLFCCSGSSETISLGGVPAVRVINRYQSSNAGLRRLLQKVRL